MVRTTSGCLVLWSPNLVPSPCSQPSGRLLERLIRGTGESKSRISGWLMCHSSEGGRTSTVAADRGLHTAVGGLRNLGAQAVALITGFATTVFLTRRLGPELYGQYSVAFGIVQSIELVAASLLSSTTVRLVAEADDWKAISSTLALLVLKKCRLRHTMTEIKFIASPRLSNVEVLTTLNQISNGNKALSMLNTLAGFPVLVPARRPTRRSTRWRPTRWPGCAPP